ncbi:MAG: TolC family protein [Candidatus Eisenbacteria bacterium]|nr:TolC family protein [Candidatus Eisenbacteria bacterium]
MSDGERKHPLRARALLGVALALGLLLPLGARGEETSNVYDLDRCLRIARETNRGLQAARVEEEKAGFRVREAWAAALPQIGLDGRIGRNFKLPSFYFGGFPSFGGEEDTLNGEGGEEIPENIRIEVGSRYDYTATLSLTQPLWLAGKVGAALQAAKIYNRSAKEDVEASEQGVVLLVKSLFYRALLAEAEAEVYRSARDRALHHRYAASLRRERGLASEFELLRAEVDASEADPWVIAAENEAARARNDLKTALGIDVREPIEVRGALEYAPILPEKIRGRGGRAAEENPDLAVLALRARLLEQNLRVVRADRFPNFYLTGQYQFSGNSDDLRFSEQERTSSSFGGVYATFPIWTSGATSSRIRQAEAELRIARIRLAEAEEDVRKAVVAAELDIESAEKRLAASEKSLAYAEKAHAIAETRYESGLLSQIELLDARLALTRSRVAHLRSIHDALLAQAVWMRVVGISWGEEW